MHCFQEICNDREISIWTFGEKEENPSSLHRTWKCSKRMSAGYRLRHVYGCVRIL